MKKLVFALIFLVASCTSIYQDITPAPINNNKMTLEMESCGKQEVGLLGCFYGEQEGKLTIPLWRSGEYQIQSERCRYFENKTYNRSQKLELSYKELLIGKPDSEKSCLYNVKVFIDGFDNGFEGFFLLSEGDLKPVDFEIQNSKHIGYAGVQLKENTPIIPKLNIKAEGEGALAWSGCNIEGEKRYSDNIELDIKEAVGNVIIPKYSCILTLGLIPDDLNLPVELGKVHINIYHNVVTALPEPVIIYKDNILTVHADNVVAGMGINDFYLVKKARHKKTIWKEVKPDEEADVRVMTSNGRFILMKVKNGEVLWVK